MEKKENNLYKVGLKEISADCNGTRTWDEFVVAEDENDAKEIVMSNYQYPFNEFSKGYWKDPTITSVEMLEEETKYTKDDESFQYLNGLKTRLTRFMPPLEKDDKFYTLSADIVLTESAAERRKEHRYTSWGGQCRAKNLDDAMRIFYERIKSNGDVESVYRIFSIYENGVAVGGEGALGDYGPFARPNELMFEMGINHDLAERNNKNEEKK